MEAWCPAVMCICLISIIAGVLWLYRARGVRIVSGRRGAMLTYLSLFSLLVFASIIACLHEQVYPIISANPDLQRIILPMLIATPMLLGGSLVCLWLGARSLGRSVIFYNVRRDELATTLSATLRELAVPSTHRLRTFRDEFLIPSACVIVHGAPGFSRLEWRGPDDAERSRLMDGLIERLVATVAARGGGVIDDRRPPVRKPARREASIRSAPPAIATV